LEAGAARTQSGRPAFVFGQGLLDLPRHGRRRAAFPFEKPQPVPQPDDFPLLVGVGVLRDYPRFSSIVNEKGTIFKSPQAGMRETVI